VAKDFPAEWDVLRFCTNFNSTTPQVKSVLKEHANLIPVLIVKRMKYVSMESADRPEVMRTPDKLNLFKR
jgi:hypothetical protein